VEIELFQKVQTTRPLAHTIFSLPVEKKNCTSTMIHNFRSCTKSISIKSLKNVFTVATQLVRAKIILKIKYVKFRKLWR
jgi:hypothetical protein